MVMVFTLVSAVQERLAKLVDEVKEEKLKEKQRQEAEQRVKDEVSSYVNGLDQASC